MAATSTRSDSSHIETRLLVVAEMLEKAVQEVRRAMDEVKSGIPSAAQFVDEQNESPRSTDDC